MQPAVEHALLISSPPPLPSLQGRSDELVSSSVRSVAASSAPSAFNTTTSATDATSTTNGTHAPANPQRADGRQRNKTNHDVSKKLAPIVQRDKLATGDDVMNPQDSVLVPASAAQLVRVCFAFLSFLAFVVS
eukprot:jgi/Chrzof1/4196/Cz14g02160.t1